MASRSIISTMCYQAPNDRNTLIVQSIQVRPGYFISGSDPDDPEKM